MAEDNEQQPLDSPEGAKVTNVYLRFGDPVKPYRLDNLSEAYRDIASELKRIPDDAAFEKVGEKSGTHVMRLRSPRAGGPMIFQDRRSNRALRHGFGGDGALSPVAKVAYRPIAIEGESRAAGLVDHLVDPDDTSASVIDAFVDVFGQAALDALRRGLAENRDRPLDLFHENFPVVFAPGLDGGDIQITPISSIEAHLGLREVRQPFFEKKTAANPEPRRGSFCRLAISGKMQNIAASLPQAPRSRFLARFPADLMGRFEAEVFRFAKGGAFPRMTDQDDGALLADYGSAVARHIVGTEGQKPYRNANIDRGLDARADWLIDRVVDFQEEVEAELSGAGLLAEDELEARMATAPSPDRMLRQLLPFLPKSEQAAARTALDGAHFADRMNRHRRLALVRAARREEDAA